MKFQANQKQIHTLMAAAILIVAGMLCAAPVALAQVNPPATSAVNLYPAGVAFFDQFVGTIGPVQTVTLTNNGTAALSITKIAASAGFSQTNSCGASVAPGASCTISIRFKPTSAMLLTGTVTVTDSAPTSPQTINLRGTGVNNAIAFSTTNLNAGTQMVNTASGPVAVTVTNISGAAVTVSSIVATGDFTQTNSCVSPLPPTPSTACRIDVVFKPTAVGTREGTVTITDSAPGSPHVVQLSGVGGVSSLTFSPTTLTFGNINLGRKSAAKNVTVTNNGSSPITFLSITGNGDYTETDTCGTSIAVGGTCTLTVTFAPSGSGKRNGRVTFNDTDPSNLQTLTLSGVGVVPASTVAVSPRAATLTSQQNQQYSATINGVSSNAVTWAVDGVLGGNTSVGTISTAGLYKPPSTAGRHAIKATSTADSSQAAVSFAYVTNYAGTFTYHNDTMRTGQNLKETVLTPGNVNSAQFGKVFSFPVDGKVYAQPLYVPNVNIPGKGVHNVIYVATEHDSVYAFDADNLTSTPLWQTSFISPADGVTTLSIGTSGGNDITCDSMKPEVGITGTPVINAATKTMYLVARTKEVSGGHTNFVQKLHQLDITTGADKANSPVVIQASVPGNGTGYDGQGNVLWDPLIANQRSGLLLMNGVVYIAFASFCDPPNFHGWLLAYDSTSLQQLQAFNTSPNGWAGGVWGSGSAPAADASGNIYIATGNGTFDGDFGGSNYSDSILKLSTNGSLSLVDSFTPFNQYYFIGADLDLGSGGVTVVPDQTTGPAHLLFGGGKTGDVYLLNRDNMGGYNASNNNQILSDVVHAAGGTGKGDKGIWPKGAYWQNQIYYVGTGDVPKAYRVYNGQLSPNPISEGNFVFAYPGGLPAISSNGDANGIVWIVWEATPIQAQSVLYAFEADNLSVQLYNSTGTTTGLGVQFGVPTVANGRVYVGTAGELDVYGLLP
jgi:Abnormal spindle-like microcephaly-assoc'd, ASPM-SPD-2-Hydin/Protein of unknown function (DUF1573)